MVSAAVVPSANDFASADAPLSVPHSNSPAETIRDNKNQDSSDSPPAQTAVDFASLNASALPARAANRSHAPLKATAAIANWHRTMRANPAQLVAGEWADATVSICRRIAPASRRFSTAYISAVRPVRRTSRLLKIFI